MNADAKATPIISNAGSPCGAAVTVHREQLWCLWVDKDHAVKTRTLTEDGKWVQYGSTPAGATTTFQPAAASFEGELHVVYVGEDKNRTLNHIAADPMVTWSRGPEIKAQSKSAPALTVHDGKLFLAFTANNDANELLYCYLDPTTDKWSPGYKVGERTWGTPALAEIRGQLHLLFAENNDNRQIIDLVYDATSTDPAKAWHRNQRTDEHSAGGVAATGFGQFGYLLFQDNSDLSLQRSNYLSRWAPGSAIGEVANDVPAVTVFRDKLSVVFIAKNDSRSLMWWQGDVKDTGDSEWMKAIPGIAGRQLKELCFPGAHDSGTYQLFDDFVPPDLLYGIDQRLVALHDYLHDNDIPYGDVVDGFIDSLVEDMGCAQELTVAEQLDWGVRSLDLRACYMNEDYYTFHAFRGNRLEVLLDDIAGFLDRTSGEVVWLWFSPRGMEDKQLSEVRSMVTEKLGPYCFPVTSDHESSARLGTCTVGEVLKAGQRPGTSRVIIVDDALGETGLKGSAFWAKPGDIRYSAYSNTSTLSTMVSDGQPGQEWSYRQWRTEHPQVPTFELCMTLTPQSDDIIAEFGRRLVETLSINIVKQIFSYAGIPWPPPAAKFSSLHQLSEQATGILSQFDKKYSNQRFNFISLDFTDSTDALSIAKQRCTQPPPV